MNDKIADQPAGATPLDDISGLLRDDITTRGPLDEAESLNIVNAVEWLDRGRLPDVFTVDFYRSLHARMYDQVWSWAGTLRSDTGATPNIGVPPEAVPREIGRVAMEFNQEWEDRTDDSEERSAYIAALNQADQGDHGPLIDYLTGLNGDR